MATDTINVSINGELREVPSNCCVASLLDWLKVAQDRVAVELNRTIVRKRDWAEAVITRDAQIEIVEFVGGG